MAPLFVFTLIILDLLTGTCRTLFKRGSHSDLPIMIPSGAIFFEFKLVNGTWDVKNPQGKLERVRPQDIQHTALLTVDGDLDDISGS
eukprot:gene39494-63190_t